MKTDDEVIEVLNRTLLQIYAPIDELIDGALVEATQLRRRRKKMTAFSVLGVAAAAAATVLTLGLLTRGEDRPVEPVGQPSPSQGTTNGDESPRMQQMLALLEEHAPGHDYSQLHLEFDNDTGTQLGGTVDGAFFKVFGIAPGNVPIEVERKLVNCDSWYHSTSPDLDDPYCRGGYRSYPDGTSRLLLRTVGLDQGEVGLDIPVIRNVALVFFPDGAEVGVSATNAPDIVAPPAPIMELPAFTLDELGAIASDPRWDEMFGPDSTGASGEH